MVQNPRKWMANGTVGQMSATQMLILLFFGCPTAPFAIQLTVYRILYPVTKSCKWPIKENYVLTKIGPHADLGWA